MKKLLPFLALATFLAGCSGGTSHARAQHKTHVKLVVTIQRALALRKPHVRYTLSCPEGAGSFPQARAACRKLASDPAMLHPPRMTSTCVGAPGIPPEVDVKGKVNTRAVDFSLTACQHPSARANAARRWLALAPLRRADLGRRRGHGSGALSPDRRRFAFVRGTALFVIDLRSRHVQRVSRGGMATNPHWVMSGRRIIYAGCRPADHAVEPCTLWNIRSDGSDPRNLTGSLWTYPDFFISPNGRWIAYNTAPPGEYGLGLLSPEHHRLWAARIDGSDRRVLATGSLSDTHWSGNGAIHFVRHPNGQSPSGTPWTVSLSGHAHRIR